MKRLAALACLLAACATTPPATVNRQPATQPAPAPATARSPNALTAAAGVTKSIAEPRIRVGMLTDQTKVSFPRVAGGYYLITDAGASTLRRGFTLTAP